MPGRNSVRLCYKPCNRLDNIRVISKAPNHLINTEFDMLWWSRNTVTTEKRVSKWVWGAGKMNAKAVEYWILLLSKVIYL